ncbi:hypothetical protein J2752_000273 [Halarchaeum rubridurum]|uniref:Uncharacterized protein n=1 Tax=Halarchaeum rubridurum TaxID=489911 RepID=A0A830FV30_9EURY|nr:hypothetical protein [Halarchaeum rubridurum]MBP1953392.1 hypothetical protein [Halarchaeum rubridurum]GGM65640.1 hypothetical protein GCM10009017_14660 [Halarchaeum rubridurum]
MTERGVSDAVGFVLIFALIITSVGVIYTAGLTGLQDARDAQRLSNAETAFDAIDTTANDVVYRGAPSRTVGVGLAGATLGPGDDVRITVNGSERSVHATLTPLVYRYEDSRFVYVGGAVLRSDGADAVVLDDPDVRVAPGGGRALVPVINTTATGGTVGGRTRARVSFAARGPGTRGVTVLDGPVTVTVETPRADAWSRSFADVEACTDVSMPTSETARCTLDGESAVVSRTDVTVQVE